MSLSIPLNTVYKLSVKDLAFCVKIGAERWKVNRQTKNVRDQMYSAGRSSIDCSIVGVIGEYAVLKLAGLPIDPLRDTSPCSHKTDRGDIISPCGRKVDVKSPVGLHCTKILVRACNNTNLPFAYALAIIDREREPEAKAELEALKQQNGGKVPPNKVSFLPNEEIRVVFRGFVAAQEAIQTQNLIQFYGKPFYAFPQHRLKHWDMLVPPPQSLPVQTFAEPIKDLICCTRSPTTNAPSGAVHFKRVDMTKEDENVGLPSTFLQEILRRQGETGA